MSIKHDKNESILYIFRKYSLKVGKMDNFWVGHSVVKPVYAESFQRRKDIKKGGDGENDDFDMEILVEGALEKAKIVKNKTPDKNPQKTIYKVI